MRRFLTVARILAPVLLGLMFRGMIFGQTPERTFAGAAQMRPAQDRPYFMPAVERQRIQELIRTQAWAKAEYERLRTEAGKGDGFSAGLLYALEGDAKHLAAARKYLLGALGPDAWGVREYTKRLADPEHFRTGAGDLANVYYDLSFEPFVVFDWVYRGLGADDRKLLEQGIRTLARYRMKAMDRWTQTPNLVFKPTFMVAMAGLALNDPEMIEWGFFRSKPHGARLGGYFRVLDVMLLEGGPWREATIYPIAHEDLWCFSVMSRYGGLWSGRDWWTMRTAAGDSPKGLADYFIDTAYPLEPTGQGAGQVRVATYGDGATNAKGDLFLVNPAGDGLNAAKALAAAYNASGDPRYAAFLKLAADYKPDLWYTRPLPPQAPLPAAPSKIWPRYGLAILRSDETPAYWNNGRAIAVFQLMSQGYGHDHRDKFAIMLHGAGRLLYPDYNAIQYENSAIGWTRNTPSHNTLLVDEQDAADATPTAVRHEFSPELKYLATSASGVFEGVEQTRVLVLTREYLLDVFHAAGKVPHRYDYMLHCFGKARPTGGNFRPAPDLMPRYWVIDAKQAMTTDAAWGMDFAYKEPPGSRGGNYGPPWYDHTAQIRLSMAAEPETLVTYGAWGKKYWDLVAGRQGDKPRCDELASLTVRRSGLPSTVFIATHEPYANREQPRVRGVVKLAQTADAALVRVDAAEWTDYAGVSFGPQQERAVHLLSDGNVAFQFRDYAYVRVARDGRATAWGGLVGLRIPGISGPLTLAGKPLPAAQAPGALVHLAAEATPPPAIDPPCPLAVSLSPAELRGWTRDRKSMSLAIRNTLLQPVAGRIEFDLPQGIVAQPPRVEFAPIAAGRTATVPLEFAVQDPPQNKTTLAYRIVYRQGETGREIRTRAQPIVAYAGPTIEQVYRFPKPAVYRAVTSSYTAGMRMPDGACVFLADDSDQVRLDGPLLFYLSTGDKDKRAELLGDEPKMGGVWTGNAPANLVAEALASKPRFDMCRWQALFMPDRILFRMDRDWTRSKTMRFTLPGKWVSPGGPPRWRRLVALDDAGRPRDTSPGQQTRLMAALLEFPGSPWHLAFQFQPPVPVTFQGAGLEFSIGSLANENWQIGFCKAEGFDAWRGRQ
jgi:hypothetical protein